jgi:hypothetical protein
MLSKEELKMLAKLSDANWCFFICEKLVADDLHICGEKIINSAGEEFECSEAIIKYFVERLLFRSDKFYKCGRDLDELVKKYRYIFLMEMSSNDALVAMLGK